MKFRGSVLAILVVLGVVWFSATKPTFNSDEKEEAILFAVTSFVDKMHFSPHEINDDLSQKIYSTYLKRIDNGKRFLTAQDVAKLEPFKLQIDDEINNKNFEFFNTSVELLENGVNRAKSFYKELLEQPFDFTVAEDFEVDGDKRSFANSEEELKELWRKILKYETLVRLNDKMEAQEEDEELEEKKSMATLEVEAREKVKEVFDEWFKNLGKLERTDRFEVFVNTFTHAFDPHTDYFNPKDKEDFDMRMAGHFEGIGARLQTDGDFTKIVQIIPGGPAWKGKELEEDDIIISVAQEGDEPVDITGMRIDKVVTLIRGKKGTNVYLKVKKVDGTKETIKITRDKVVTDDGKAVSLVLDQGDSFGNIGYIYLPSFYADFGDKNGRSSATDVAKEIENLKAENVNGIILDLRNNGGGSFKDVVDMSGFFIEKGPIVQAKSRGRDPYALKDTDPTVNYDGPVIVMVNGYSASASEILAAALQDYKRAVIVGSTSTYGKGTVQRFFDLDRGIQGADNLKPLGELKLTTQKFYRIDGGSTQLKGVVPDIFLPDNFQYVKTGEKDTDYPLEWTKIEPVKYEQNVRVESNIEGLKAASEARVAKNEIFNKILDNAKRFEKLDKETTMSLQYDAFDKMSDAREEEAKKYKDISKEIPGLSVKNIASYLEEIAVDSSKIDRNQAWKENILKDVYLEETIAIMRDMISSN